MTAQPAIPVVVVTGSEDDVEAVSRCLRNAGQPAHCQWIIDCNALPEVLRTGRAQLMCVVLHGDYDLLTRSADHRDRCAAGLPLLAVDTAITEEAIARAMVDGARDLVSLDEPVRFSAVALRELHSFRTTLERDALHGENQALNEQLASLIDESAAPTVYASEGIIITVNPAWLELFGYADAEDLTGTPALDLFAPESRTTIKGAMIACAEGKWSGHEVSVRVESSDGSALGVIADLQQSQYEGDACVRINMAPDRPAGSDDGFTGRHPVTGLFLRERFVSELNDFLERPTGAGVSVLAYLKPDEMGEARDMLDPVTADRLTLDMAAMLNESVKPNDIYGQFGGDVFMVVLSRGTLRDAYAWADNLRHTVAHHVFEAGDKSLSLTCTIGLAQLDPHNDDIYSLMRKAQRAFRDGRDNGGDQVILLEKDGSLDRGAAAVSFEALKQALMQDGFRLVFQPVASMLGKSREMYDVLIRMRGPEDKEIMPADFLPTARQAGLMKNIDRWVTVNAMGFCRQHSQTQLFVRLSENTITDQTFVPWAAQQLESSGISASQIVFQVTENHAEDHVKDCRELARQLQTIGCGFAIEHFGVGHRPLQTLEHIPTNVIKIDGSLMEGLVNKRALQEKVKLYIEAAKSRNIETIAERVEDANTMAVLWQLGVEFIQGYYVQGPEEVVLESSEFHPEPEAEV